MPLGPTDVKVSLRKDELAAFRDLERECEGEDGAVMRLHFPEIEQVVVDAQVVLRIAKHAADNATRSVVGRLLGMQFDGVVQVSSAVPLVQHQGFKMPPEEKERLEQEDWNKMLEHLKAEQFDTFQVGRYAVAANSGHINTYQLNQLLTALREGHPALLLAYDPQKTAAGKLGLKALVPTTEFFNMYHPSNKNAPATGAADASKLRAAGVLREVPVEMRPSTLQAMLLRDMIVAGEAKVPKPVAPSVSGATMEKALQALSEGAQKLHTDLLKTADDRQQSLKQEAHLTTLLVQTQARNVASAAATQALALNFAATMAQQQ